MAKSNEVESPAINIIGNGTVIKGDIKSNGDMRIDGTLIGSVNAKGKVVIGTTGNVDGEIICMNGDFSGTVKAQVSVTELLQLKSTSRLTGDLITGKLAIEPGAKFSGTCNMQESTAKPENILIRPNDEKPKATT